MFFYASLFVVCFIAACILFWMFRSLREVGTAVYRAFLPSYKNNARTERLTHLSDHLGSTATPWGWESSNSSVRAAPHRRSIEPGRRVEADTPDTPVPWGWRGNQNNQVDSRHSKSNLADKAHISAMVDTVRNSVGTSDASDPDSKVGWPYRDESFDFAGTKYKYSSKRKARKAGSSKSAKPWGW